MKDLVRAAVVVVGDAQAAADPGSGSREALKRDVSRFLQSLQHFPEQPLPFPIAVYRDYFVLVAERRNDEPSIDARHTIDCMRLQIESSTDVDRFELDQELVKHPDFFGGPADLTSRLLSLLVVLHNDAGFGLEAYAKVANLLVASLERATELVAGDTQQRPHLLALLGLMLDATVELEGREINAGIAAGLTSRGGQIFADLIWRDETQIKMAAGILDRIQARSQSAGCSIAASIALAIVKKLEQELEDALGGIAVVGASLLMPISAIFEFCLSFVSFGGRDALSLIETSLLKPLSWMMSEVLGCAIEHPGHDHIAELDRVATTLYDLCDQALRLRSP
ncbi:hypothetical protein PSEUBRA_000689 [Kalmanozyma brasiliensis GHG001]|uniref:uncharacterized protein n=1 Tax=Kalmanozyma brasiliensis (strain GHG001) TaxID=1365824 RepID=UPI0028681F09|nr:uncharacterized protein PSEUBRA_000689 [Kalmanozyma brasiliensis GHG001]KAF6766832.1 hypothetical protein PSEUBRA_000689 [Kalmanozyma brasiliensis GHG001]